VDLVTKRSYRSVKSNDCREEGVISLDIVSILRRAWTSKEMGVERVGTTERKTRRAKLGSKIILEALPALPIACHGAGKWSVGPLTKTLYFVPDPPVVGRVWLRD
jgi:hypothetical protein